jgi:shikimate kinase
MEVIFVWIKYTGELPYNSMEIRGVLPGSKNDIKESLAKKLIKKRPKWFKSCSAPIVPPKKGSGAEVIDEPVVETKEKEEVKKK